jgi:hypothetical protein
MNNSILVTRPNHDTLTNYLSYWSKLVIDEAIKHNIKPLDLLGIKATKKNVTSYITKHNPKLLFFNGHGDEDRIGGYDNDIIIEVNQNVELLKDKIVYVRSCDVAANLGKVSIQKGTLAFIGYTKKYTLCTSTSSQSRPMQDIVAQLFLLPSNLIPISLIKGNSAREAYQKSQNSLIRNIRFMLSTKASQEQKDALPYLWSNRKYQVLLGNGNACI